MFCIARFPHLIVYEKAVKLDDLQGVKKFLSSIGMDIEFLLLVPSAKALVLKAKKFVNAVLIPEDSILAILPDHSDILILNPEVYNIFYMSKESLDVDSK